MDPMPRLVLEEVVVYSEDEEAEEDSREEAEALKLKYLN
jgi:hypothetical protein